MTAATESDLREIEARLDEVENACCALGMATPAPPMLLDRTTAARAALLAAIEKYGQKKWDDAIKYTISEARDHD